jgi:ribosome assembly protein 1
MDSTEEEQKRGITMHSSAISLLYDLEDRKKVKEDDVNTVTTKDEFLINLVDSPGHIDFSSDVSTATRLCDGALIVIDVLEGICTQTHAVLYKALKERMRPCLVLNKIDRLYIDMRLNTVEAFQHLRRLVENVNALAFTLLNSEILKRNEAAEALGIAPSVPKSSVDEDDEDDPLVVEWTFSPEKGNVVFAGALDCWGFGLAKFVNLRSIEYGINKNTLRKYLFDDFSYNKVSKKMVRWDPSGSSSGGSDVKPMFAEMVLDPIWKIYELAVTNQEPEKAAKMALNKVSRGFRFWLCYLF